MQGRCAQKHQSGHVGLPPSSPTFLPCCAGGGAAGRRAGRVAAGGGGEGCGGWTEGRITNAACHMVKQRRFTTDRVPHRQHGVVASECQVWEWDQTPALACAPSLATAARGDWLKREVWREGRGLVASWCLCRFAYLWGSGRRKEEMVEKSDAGLDGEQKAAHCEISWIKEMEPKKRECETLRKMFHLFFLSVCSQGLWFIHRWHHGDHSYFYWLVNGQLFFMICHLSNPHQSTSPWEEEKKKSTTQKWLRVERQNMIHACHATVLGMFRKSNVLSLLLLCSPYLPALFMTPGTALCVRIKMHKQSIWCNVFFLAVNFDWTSDLLPLPLRDLGFVYGCACMCVLVWVYGRGYSWHHVVCS